MTKRTDFFKPETVNSKHHQHWYTHAQNLLPLNVYFVRDSSTWHSKLTQKRNTYPRMWTGKRVCGCCQPSSMFAPRLPTQLSKAPILLRNVCCNISAHLATTANYIPSLTTWSVSYLRATSGLWKNRRAKDSLCISPGDNMSSLQETEEYPNAYLSYRNKKWEELYAPSIQLRRMPQCDNYRSAGMPASRWEIGRASCRERV